MQPLPNDRWRGTFTVTRLGRYLFTLEAWVDHFRTWHTNSPERVNAGQEIHVDLLIGAQLIESAAKRAGRGDSHLLTEVASRLRHDDVTAEDIAQLQSSEFLQTMERHPDLSFSSVFEKELEVIVDPEKAQFSAWYELFPRSTGRAGTHGRLEDVQARIPAIAAMGFDVLYLPPIHPSALRSEKEGTIPSRRISPRLAVPGLSAPRKVVTSPFIPSSALSRISIACRRSEIARHGRGPGHRLSGLARSSICERTPAWFRKRPDGTIQYAENPPKKYQDIYPFDFESKEWQSLWNELLDIFVFWMDKGVRIFRVDNPHTKALPFWEWCIGRIKQRFPDVIFLSEAFTRPKVMYYLAKAGFSQSYTYFAWRRSASELGSTSRS